MQNIIKVSRLLFLIFAMLTIVTVCYANPVQAKTNEKLIYQKFLRKEYKKLYSGNGAKRGFYLIDLDGKGVKELVLTREESGATGDSTFYVYTIKNKRVRQIGLFYHRSACRFFEYNNKAKSIRCETTAGSAHYWFRRYKCKSNKLKPEFCCSNEYSSSKKVRYIINRNANGYGGKTVSKAEYNRYYKKHYSSIKWKKYYMKELTLSNTNTL